MSEALWTFKTARFTVEFTAEEEFDLDLSWGETDKIADRINGGELVVFCAKVAVYLDGREIATNYLGQCIYGDAEEFISGHRDVDPMNRNCSIMRAECGNVSIYHYFPGMVSIVVAEARKVLQDVPNMREVA